MFYAFFCVISRRLNFICRRFGTLCLFHLHRLVGDGWLNLRIVWVANGRSFGSKIACANSKEGDLLSHGPPWHKPHLFHIPARNRYVGCYRFTTCCVTVPPLLRHPPYCDTFHFWAKPSPIGYPNYSQIWSFITYQPMKMEQTECSETSAYKIQMPGNYPKENIQYNIYCFLKHCNSIVNKKKNRVHCTFYSTTCVTTFERAT